MILDFIDDLNADPTGTSASDDSLKSLEPIAEAVRIEVPPGQYLFEETHEITSREDIGFSALGGRKPRFIVGEGIVDEWLRFNCDLLLAGIDIDRSAPETSPTITVRSDGKALVSGVDMIGTDDVPTPETSVFDVAIDDPRGNVVFRNVGLPASSGAIRSDGHAGRKGIYAPSENLATITVENCRIEECAGPGIDTCSSTGELRVKGGTFRNNNIAQICFSGDGATVDGANVVVDPERAQHANTGLYESVSGLDVRAPRETEVRSGEIVDCSVLIDSGSADSIGAGIYGSSKARHTEIRNTDVEVNVDDVSAVRFDTPVVEMPDPAIETDVQCENMICRGSAESGTAIEILDRPGSRLQYSCIESPGLRQPFTITPKSGVNQNVTDVRTATSCDFFRGMST